MKGLALIILNLIGHLILAQSIPHNQLNYSTYSWNPSSSFFRSRPGIILFNESIKNENLSLGNRSGLSTFIPILRKESWSVFGGLNHTRENHEYLLTTIQYSDIMLGWAHQTDKHILSSSISAGINYFNIDRSSITTPDQWNSNSGFDENYISKDVIFNTVRKDSYYSIASVSYTFLKNHNELINLNIAGNVLEQELLLNAGIEFRVYNSSKFSIYPTVNYFQKQRIINSGIRFQYELDNSKNINLVLRGTSGKVMSNCLQFQLGALDLGLNFDTNFPVPKMNGGNYRRTNIVLKINLFNSSENKKPDRQKNTTQKILSYTYKSGIENTQEEKEIDLPDVNYNGKTSNAISSVYHQFNFKFNSTEIGKENHSFLDSLANYLIENKKLKLVIIGHSDYVGDSFSNQKLSEKRAEEVGDFLMNKGVEPNRITTLGKGENDPLTEKEDKNSLELNRRVEMIIYLKDE